MGYKEKSILLVYNNASGSGESVDSAAEAANILFKKRHPFDLRQFTDITNDPQYVNQFGAICVYGGDGTFYTMADIVGKSEMKPPLVPIPTGTENVLSGTIHGPKVNPPHLLKKTIATLNGETKALNRLQLQSGEYRLDESRPYNFYWLLTAGDSGLTHRTLGALDKRGPRRKLFKSTTVIREALRHVDIESTVKVTVFDEQGEIFDEFDALEGSIVKRIPGKWSRVQVAPPGDREDQILTIGRGKTDYGSRRFIYSTFIDTLAAATSANVPIYDPRKDRNRILTRLPINPGHTVVFSAVGEKPFQGTVTDSEVLKSGGRRIVIEPNAKGPVIEVFSVRNFNRA